MFRFLIILLGFNCLFAQEKVVDTALVNSVNEQILSLRKDGKYKEALTLNDNLLQTLKKDSTTLSYARTLHTRSRVEIDLGNYDTAIVHAAQAKKVYQELSKFTEVAAMENIIGVGFYFKSEIDSTLKYYNRSYDLKKQFEKDTIQLAISIFNIGIVYEDQGKYQDAIDAYGEAEELLAVTSEKAGFMSDLYVALSNVHRSRNDLVKSKSYAQLALKESIENYGEDNPSTSFVYVSNAGLYRAMGDYENAKPFLKKALELRKKYYGPKHRWTVEGYRSLAKTYLNLKQIDSALSTIKKAILISEEKEYSLDIAHNYIEKARILIEAKQWKKAATLPKKSRLLYHTIFGENHQFIAESYFMEATVAFGMEDIKATTQSLQKVYVAARYNPSNLTTLNAPFIVAKALHMDFELTNSFERKMQLIEQQIGLINHIKNYYQTPEAKLFYNATTASNISDYVHFYYQKFIENNSEIYFSKAIELVQLATNSILAQERQNVALKNISKEGEAAFHKLTQARQLWAKINQDLYYEETAIAPEKTILDSLLERKSDISMQLDKALATYNQFSQNTSNDLTALTLEEITEKLDAEQQLFQYYLGKDQAYVFVITKDEHQMLALGTVTELHEGINNFRKQLIHREPIQDQLQKLSFYLFPKQITIPHKNLVILPDGILAYVPFELLMVSSEKPLIDDHNISYQAALSLLNFQATTTNYSNYWSGFGVAYEGLQSLPKGVEEIKTIAKLTKGEIYLNEAATQVQLFKKGKESKILHLALHGVIDQNNPLYSKFLLENETITASEIYNQEIASNLVVLSACETGYGTLQKGEGVMSLSRAFTYAGASSTIMSLWEVPDQQTAQLMNYFYTYLEDGYAKDEALRMAKLDFVNSSNTYLKHPYYWAGFVVSGDTSPISKLTSFSQYLTWTLLILGVISIVLWILWKKRT